MFLKHGILHSIFLFLSLLTDNTTKPILYQIHIIYLPTYLSTPHPSLPHNQANLKERQKAGIRNSIHFNPILFRLINPIQTDPFYIFLVIVYHIQNSQILSFLLPFKYSLSLARSFHNSISKQPNDGSPWPSFFGLIKYMRYIVRQIPSFFFLLASFHFRNDTNESIVRQVFTI